MSSPKSKSKKDTSQKDQVDIRSFFFKKDDDNLNDDNDFKNPIKSKEKEREKEKERLQQKEKEKDRERERDREREQESKKKKKRDSSSTSTTSIKSPLKSPLKSPSKGKKDDHNSILKKRKDINNSPHKSSSNGNGHLKKLRKSNHIDSDDEDMRVVIEEMSEDDDKENRDSHRLKKAKVSHSPQLPFTKKEKEAIDFFSKSDLTPTKLKNSTSSSTPIKPSIKLEDQNNNNNQNIFKKVKKNILDELQDIETIKNEPLSDDEIIPDSEEDREKERKHNQQIKEKEERERIEKEKKEKEQKRIQEERKEKEEKRVQEEKRIQREREEKRIQEERKEKERKLPINPRFECDQIFDPDSTEDEAEVVTRPIKVKKEDSMEMDSPKMNRNYDISKSPLKQSVITPSKSPLKQSSTTPSKSPTLFGNIKKEVKQEEDDEITDEEEEDIFGDEIKQMNLRKSQSQSKLKQEKKSTPSPLPPQPTIKKPTPSKSKASASNITKSISKKSAVDKLKDKQAKEAKEKLMDDKEKEEDEIKKINNQKRKHFAMGGQRAAPPKKGEMPIPLGKPDCLKGKTFLVSGVMNYFDREEIVEIIKKYGGKTTASVTKSLDYLLIGVQDFGLSKLEKVKAHKTAKVLQEDEFLAMINDSLQSLMSPTKKQQPIAKPKQETTDEEETEVDSEETEPESESSDEEMEEVKQEDEDDDIFTTSTSTTSTSSSNSPITIKKEKKEDDDVKMEDSDSIEDSDKDSVKNVVLPTPPPSQPQTAPFKKKPVSLITKKPTLSFQPASSLPKSNDSSNNNNVTFSNQTISGHSLAATEAYKKAMDQSLAGALNGIRVSSSISSQPKGNGMMWVDKYKPTSCADLIGNPGIVKTFRDWLESWSSDEPRTSKNAVLLSGPPGIGKTSLATMVLREMGYNPLELNASDTRSKSELDKLLSGISDNRSITEFFSKKTDKKNEPKKKMAIIMDEIDGSSGNADRGGIKEIIGMIHETKIPFICICNDYYSPKIKSLKNHCVDLKFRKPSSSQITDRLLQICKHEGVIINSFMLEKLFVSTHNDIRQTIHLLQMLNRSSLKLTADNIDERIKKATKDYESSPFEATEKLLTTFGKDINERMDYFFCDYGLVSMMVQENYLNNDPARRESHLKGMSDIELMSRAADSISDSDVFSKEIFVNQAWELLPAYAMTSTIIPCSYISGGTKKMPLSFPQLLGKMSNFTKQKRFVSEIQLHTRSSEAKSFSNRNETRLYYAPMFKHYLVQPLVQDKKDGIDYVIDMMDRYGFTRDDRDNILELTSWNKQDPVADVPTLVKTAFTNQWKKTSHAVYDLTLMSSKAVGGSVSNADLMIDGVGASNADDIVAQEEEENDENEIQEKIDSLIITKDKKVSSSSKSTAKKAPAKKAAASTKSKSKSK